MPNKSTRRNMDDALELTPKAISFIQHGAAARELEQETDDDERSEAPQVAEKPKRAKRLRQRNREGDAPASSERAAANSDASLLGQLLVPVTTRLQPKTAEMLRRACLEQKLSGKRPHTQQEIIELATRSWLKENGYLA